MGHHTFTRSATVSPAGARGSRRRLSCDISNTRATILSLADIELKLKIL